MRHNNKGGLSPWYLESVTIEDVDAHTKRLLKANVWLEKKTSLEVVLPFPGVYQRLQLCSK
jgi:hypothetical protein